MERRRHITLRLYPFRMVVACGIALLVTPLAARTHFTFKSITIKHSKNVNATALNDEGTIVGVVTDESGSIEGFTRGRHVTILPPQCDGFPPYCISRPTSINEHDEVAGSYYTGNCEGWVWRNGAYSGIAESLGSPECAQLGPFLNKPGAVAFNQTERAESFPYAGIPSAPQQILGLTAGLATVNSLNDHGIVAGQEQGSTVGINGEVVFAGVSGAIKTYLPKGATGSFGGFVNNAGAVAGTYSDAANITHGFVHAHGHYTMFDVPQGATSVSMLAFNNAGRGAGTYTDSTGAKQHIFFYNGLTATTIGTWPNNDHLTLALNDAGVLLMSDSNSEGIYASYIGTCSGDC